MFSSKNNWHSTPQDLFDRMDKKYWFNLDVCADKNNHKCSRYYTKEIDGLKQDWIGRCWMNPPYGREIGKWMKKAYESVLEFQSGTIVVCLVPSRTDTAWWHDYAMKGEIEFIRGRLKFGGAKYNAPFPSAIVVFSID